MAPASGTATSSSKSRSLSTTSSHTLVGQVQPPQPCHQKTPGQTIRSATSLLGTGSNSITAGSGTTSQRQYVELCVNTGRHFQRLAEIDVAKHDNDADLFRSVRQRYRELRGWRVRWQYFLRPHAMSYVEFALDRKQKVHIYRPRDAYPPQADIDAGRYLYNNPPPPIPSNAFIHFLRECDLDSYQGSQDNEILEIIAKKLDTRVSDQPCLSKKAYGMLIHEGPDITAILWTMVVMVVTLSAPLIAFFAVTKDLQSASGLFSAALAAMTLLWMGMQVDRGMNSFD
jgi:hypothetical protein